MSDILICVGGPYDGERFKVTLNNPLFKFPGGFYVVETLHYPDKTEFRFLRSEKIALQEAVKIVFDFYKQPKEIKDHLP